MEKELKKQLRDMKQPWVPTVSVRRTEIGLPPSADHQRNEVARKILKARQKEGLTKPCMKLLKEHKKYIRNLQRKKKKERLKQIEKEMEEKKRRKKQLERHRKLREELDNAQKVLESEYKSYIVEEKPPKKKIKKVKKKITKPKWASNLEGTEKEDEKEIDELLQFTNSLDFEKCKFSAQLTFVDMDDFEIREAVGVIKSRIEQMEDEVEEVEAEIKESEKKEEEKNQVTELEAPKIETENPFVMSAPVPPLKVQEVSKGVDLKLVDHEKEWDKSTRVNNEAQGSSRPSSSQAVDLKNLRKSLSSIHSDRSFKRVLEKVDNSSSKRVLVRMKKDKDNVQNLPYMYRCFQI